MALLAQPLDVAHLVSLVREGCRYQYRAVTDSFPTPLQWSHRQRAPRPRDPLPQLGVPNRAAAQRRIVRGVARSVHLVGWRLHQQPERQLELPVYVFIYACSIVFGAED